MIIDPLMSIKLFYVVIFSGDSIIKWLIAISLLFTNIGIGHFFDVATINGGDEGLLSLTIDVPAISILENIGEDSL